MTQTIKPRIREHFNWVAPKMFKIYLLRLTVSLLIDVGIKIIQIAWNWKERHTLKEKKVLLKKYLSCQIQSIQFLKQNKRLKQDTLCCVL